MSQDDEKKGDSIAPFIIIVIGVISIILSMGDEKESKTYQPTMTAKPAYQANSGNNSYDDSMDDYLRDKYEQEMYDQMATEAYYDQQCALDDCCGSIQRGTPSAYVEACGGSPVATHDYRPQATHDYRPAESTTGCPNGCTYHKEGCNVLGNHHFETQEKIYHLPGMKYYADVVVNPYYGDIWFCTEAEAIANGYRKSSE